MFGAGDDDMRWTIDPTHSTAEFSVRHLMITNVRGRFGKLSGVIEYDPEGKAPASIEASIDVSSIDTRDANRDAHLRSPDFFDVEQYPTITFKSRSVTGADGQFAAVGDLTMHGVTREVKLEVEELSRPTKDPWGNQRIGASAHTKINRKDWGLGWNQLLEAGGVAVGEIVKIELEISLVHASAAT